MEFVIALLTLVHL